MFDTVITYTPPRVKVRPVQGKWVVYDRFGKLRGLFLDLADAHMFADLLARTKPRRDQMRGSHHDPR